MSERVIKFRAWDKIEKRMMYRGIFDRNWYLTPKNDEGGCHCLREISPDDRPVIELMQFTGLFDKNGKEIYEGDKIKGVSDGNIDYPKVIATVYFDNGAFRENWFSRDLGNYTNQSYGYGNTLEIIGNIYDNPELLAGEKL